VVLLFFFAMNENKIYPITTILSERNTADDQVNWVEMNPMDMVEWILSKTTESIYSGSSTNNSGIGKAFTLPCFSGTDARDGDERCESLVRSILGDQISTDNININTVGTVKLNTSGRDMCKSRQDKAEMFQKIMSSWLLQNWVNPFHDTESLHDLAVYLIRAQCVDFSENDVNTGNKRSREEYQEGLMNMTIKKIETYLVNVRMRKWRKSIEDAFDMVSSDAIVKELFCWDVLFSFLIFPCAYSYCYFYSRGDQPSIFLKIAFVYTKERSCEHLMGGNQMRYSHLMIAIPFLSKLGRGKRRLSRLPKNAIVLPLEKTYRRL